MNHKELVSAVAAKSGLNPRQAELYLEKTVEVLKNRLLEGKSIAFHGFGSFELKRKEERLSVHPVTGARTLVPPKQVVNFKQSISFKNKLKDLRNNG